MADFLPKRVSPVDEKPATMDEIFAIFKGTAPNG